MIGEVNRRECELCVRKHQMSHKKEGFCFLVGCQQCLPADSINCLSGIEVLPYNCTVTGIYAIDNIYYTRNAHQLFNSTFPRDVTHVLFVQCHGPADFSLASRTTDACQHHPNCLKSLGSFVVCTRIGIRPH